MIVATAITLRRIGGGAYRIRSLRAAGQTQLYVLILRAALRATERF
jgi:hypothetical protein